MAHQTEKHKTLLPNGTVDNIILVVMLYVQSRGGRPSRLRCTPGDEEQRDMSLQPCGNHDRGTFNHNM